MEGYFLLACRDGTGCSREESVRCAKFYCSTKRLEIPLELGSLAMDVCGAGGVRGIVALESKTFTECKSNIVAIENEADFDHRPVLFWEGEETIELLPAV